MNSHPSIVPRPPGEESKPVRELLEDIHRRSGFHGASGILSPRLIDHIAFAATVLSVILCTGTLLAMVWEAIDPILGLKVMGSVLIVLFAFLIFRSANRSFSE